jgi:UDP-N-acetylmuramate dehydrogenase
MFQQQISLNAYNSFKVNAIASHFANFNTEDQLIALLQVVPHNKPKLILGGGSNILFTKDYDGYVLKNNIAGITIEENTNEYVILKVGAGENWHQLVTYTVEKGWYGIENLALIPGNVGACPVQNIGAYGVEVQQVITKVQYVDLDKKQSNSITNEACQFGYRDSIFKNELAHKTAITYVYFKLYKKANTQKTYKALIDYLQQQNITYPSQKDIFDAVVAIRNSKLPNPTVIGNAGSFFKNPIVSNELVEQLKLEYPNIVAFTVNEQQSKLAAGWLIEQAGCKGLQIGNVGTYDKQALVIVNNGNATGEEIYNFSSVIIEKVKNKFGVMLEREVNIL